MGVYQDEIDNNIQPMIDKFTADKAEIVIKINFLEGLGTSFSVSDFHTAAQAHSESVINDMYESDTSGATDSDLRDYVAKLIVNLKRQHGGSEYIGSQTTLLGDSLSKGSTTDDSDTYWRESNLTKDIAALESKKASWLLKESDATDTTAYDTMPQHQQGKPSGW